MEMTTHQVPQTLDAPPRVLFFTANQFIAFMAGGMVGVIIGKLIICSIVGLIVGSYIEKFSDKCGEAYIRHIAYFFGIPTLLGSKALNGFDRDLGA